MKFKKSSFIANPIANLSIKTSACYEEVPVLLDSIAMCSILDFCLFVIEAVNNPVFRPFLSLGLSGPVELYYLTSTFVLLGLEVVEGSFSDPPISGLRPRCKAFQAIRVSFIWLEFL